MKLVLISHSNLAVGMKDTVEYIMGKMDNLIAIPAYTNKDIDLESTVSTILEESETDELIIFVTDIIGGSVTQYLLKVTSTMDNIVIVSGMNLPLILEFLTKETLIDSKESIIEIQKAINLSKESIKIVELNKLDEDEF